MPDRPDAPTDAHRNADHDADDGTTLRDLGWEAPGPPPRIPGEDLDWDVVDADGTSVLVAREAGSPSAWVSMVLPGDGDRPGDASG